MVGMEDTFGGGGGGTGYGFWEWMADRQDYLEGRLNMSWSVGGIDIDVPEIDLPDVNIPDINIGGGGGTGDERDRAVSIANSAELVLQQNMNDYRAGNKSASEAAAQFDRIWSQAVSAWSTLGGEGARAIADRQSGGKYDWFSAYRPQGVALTPGTPSTGGLITGETANPLQLLGITGNSKTLAMFAVGGLIIWLLVRAGAIK